MADELYYRQRAEMLWQFQNYAEAYGPCLILADDYNDPISQLRVGFCCYFGYGVEKSASRAAYWYQKAADHGEPISQNNLGGLYETGEGIAKDEKKAVELYAQSANNGYVVGCLNLGRCYENGIGITKDISKAKYWYQIAANQGVPLAIDALKRLSSTPISTTTTQATTTSKMSKEESYRQKVNTLWESKKYAEAYVSCLILADDYGDALNQYRVGYCYEHGYGVKNDLSRAAYWYQKAAEQGDSLAQLSLVNLGICYECGDGVSKNEKRAVELYTQSANTGHVLGQYNLGRCYEYGIGVVKDLNKARDWYQKAENQGHQKAKDALKELSSIPSSTTTTQATTTSSKTTSKMSKEESYRQKVNTLWESKKYAEAYVSCLILADDYGDAVSQRRVAYCYQNGYGTDKSLSRAVYWYQKAADQGDSIAQNNLGLCYERGDGVAKDEKRAMELYMKSANSGLAVGQYNVGVCYETGRGVAKDLSKAKYWYKKAADQDHQTAKDALKQLSSIPASTTTTQATATPSKSSVVSSKPTSSSTSSSSSSTKTTSSTNVEQKSSSGVGNLNYNPNKPTDLKIRLRKCYFATDAWGFNGVGENKKLKLLTGWVVMGLIGSGYGTYIIPKTYNGLPIIGIHYLAYDEFTEHENAKHEYKVKEQEHLRPTIQCYEDNLLFVFAPWRYSNRRRIDVKYMIVDEKRLAKGDPTSSADKYTGSYMCYDASNPKLLLNSIIQSTGKPKNYGYNFMHSIKDEYDFEVATHGRGYGKKKETITVHFSLDQASEHSFHNTHGSRYNLQDSMWPSPYFVNNYSWSKLQIGKYYHLPSVFNFDPKQYFDEKKCILCFVRTGVYGFDLSSLAFNTIKDEEVVIYSDVDFPNIWSIYDRSKLSK